METEERIQALENELSGTKKEIHQILMDICAFLMEVQTPLRSNREIDS